MWPKAIPIREKSLATFNRKEGKVFRPHEIIDLVVQKYPATSKSGILPADCCYNMINKGTAKQLNVHAFKPWRMIPIAADASVFQTSTPNAGELRKGRLLK
jgi:hypothetical protein